MFNLSNDPLKKEINGQLHWHHSLLSNWGQNEEMRLSFQKGWMRTLKSVKKHGIKKPFVIGEDGTVYDGNHRLKAINELVAEGLAKAENGKELEWVPVEVRNPKTEIEKLAIAMEENGDTDFAVWNKDYVANNKVDFEMVPGYEDYIFTYNEPDTYEEVFEEFSDDVEADDTLTEDKPKKVKEVTCPNCSHVFTA